MGTLFSVGRLVFPCVAGASAGIAFDESEWGFLGFFIVATIIGLMQYAEHLFYEDVEIPKRSLHDYR